MAAGVFGIARTIGAPSAAPSPANVRPAMMLTTTPCPTNRASAGMAASAVCGFTASTMAAGVNSGGIA